VEALAGFGGAVVVVSHDRHLLGLIADRLVLVDGGTAKDFEGTLDDYRAMVLRPGNGGGEDGGGRRPSRRDERRLGAELRESAKALRKQVVQAEAEMKRLWQQRAEIDEMLSRPNANGASVAELMKTRAEVERRLATAEESWIEASEAVERSLS
ncbi:MAG TPA: ABC transporter ATP-binding protein, partial [Methyloceanibacter sp.]|nr:ABC transporter ATP-binding protein [Methyloceanibacter sp.]